MRTAESVVAAGGQRIKATPRSQGCAPADHQGVMLPDRVVGAKAAGAPRPKHGFPRGRHLPLRARPHVGLPPLIIDAGIPKATLNRDSPAWKRRTEFCTGVQTQPWRLDRNAHSGADPVGFDRESRLLCCAFLISCYEMIQPRSKIPKAAKPASAFKMIDSVRSCHRRASIFMVSTRQLTMVINIEALCAAPPEAQVIQAGLGDTALFSGARWCHTASLVLNG